MKRRSLLRSLWSLLRRLADTGSRRGVELRRVATVPPPAVAAWELRLLGLQQAVDGGTERTAVRLDELQRSLTAIAERLERVDTQIQVAQADLLTRLDAVQVALDRVAQTHAEATQATLGGLQGELAGAMHDLRTALAALQEGVSGLDRQLGRAGREQLRANSLLETQQQQTQAALDQLRDLLARREAELAGLRDQLRMDQAAARLQVVERLLPALDGLNEARAAGQKLLERANAPEVEQSHTLAPSLGQRLALVFGLRPSPAVPAPESPDVVQLRSALDAWLQGLAFVEERLLEVLAAEGVHPIPTQGQPFDPHQHMAVDTVPVTNGILPGTIVAEFRRGYTVNEHVLRPAEVVVAKSETVTR